MGSVGSVGSVGSGGEEEEQGERRRSEGREEAESSVRVRRKPRLKRYILAQWRHSNNANHNHGGGAPNANAMRFLPWRTVALVRRD
jgi:hypothetical protein